MFVLAAPACSKRSVGEDGGKKSDGVEAGRESELRKKIPLYSNPSNNYIIQTAYVKKKGTARIESLCHFQENTRSNSV